VTYGEAIRFLHGLGQFGMNPGLENTRRLVVLAGNPQNQLRFIHVAGTNGKGSTCAMLESIYRAAGLRVGLFTSPHLVSFRERIQVNRQMIPEDVVARLVGDIKDWIETGRPPPPPVAASFSLRRPQPASRESESPGARTGPPSIMSDPERKLKLAATGPHPTFFEVVTVVALRHFAEQKCDLVIWETGLGGRLDATNIVTPLASVITNIGFDHQQWLGDTLGQIAAEKAGIIKLGVPVITAVASEEAWTVINARATSCQAPVTRVVLKAGVVADHPPGLEGNVPSTPSPSAVSVLTWRRPSGAFQEQDLHRKADQTASLAMDFPIPLHGFHQRINAATAIATVSALRDQIPVTDDQLRRGLETVEWPGRFQSIPLPGGRTVVLDGAHNPEGALALRDAMRSRFPGARPTLVLGVLQDKDPSGICAALAPLAGRVLLTAVNSERTASPGSLRDLCAKANPSAELETCDSAAQALEKAAADPLVLVAGSLYLIGEAMELLEVTGDGIINERGLNEWNRKK